MVSDMRFRAHAPEDHEKVGVFLRGLRTGCGVSQAELAKRLGRPQSFVAKVEIGARQLLFLEFLDWCEALELDARESFGRFS